MKDLQKEVAEFTMDLRAGHKEMGKYDIHQV